MKTGICFSAVCFYLGYPMRLPLIFIHPPNLCSVLCYLMHNNSELAFSTEVIQMLKCTLSVEF